MYLSSNIKYLRKKKKLHRMKMATETGIKARTIEGYEQNKIVPSLFRTVILADYFNVNIDDLVRKDLSAK